MSITLDFRKLVSTFTIVLWGLSLAAFIFVIGLTYWNNHTEPIHSALAKKTLPAAPDYSLIGEGALAMGTSGLHSALLQHVQKELQLLAILNRPDRTGEAPMFLIGLKNSGEQMRATSGQKIYLADNQSKMTFSTKPTALTLVPKLENNGMLLSVETKTGLQPGFFIKGEKTKGSFPHCFRNLKEAKCLGVDRFLQTYSNSSGKKRHLIELTKEKESYFLSVGADDYLTWDGAKWKKVELSEAIASAPLAQVTESHSGLELKTWDENGFFCFLFSLAPSPVSKSQVKFEEVFTQLRRKNSSQVSCLLGKKKVILKKGDWWIKTGSSWHTVRTLEELTAVVEHRMKGELFVFDSLEKVQGKFYVKGHVFDETHTSVQTVSVPVSEKKLPTKSNKPVKNVTSRSMPPPKGDDKNSYAAEDELWENTP